MASYKIVRYYKNSRRPRVIKRGLTLAEARKHTGGPKTQKKGVYFDGFTKE